MAALVSSMLDSYHVPFRVLVLDSVPWNGPPMHDVSHSGIREGTWSNVHAQTERASQI